MDALVVPGFSRIGFELRSRLMNWESIESIRCDGKTFVITGPTSGLGLATARLLASTGARLVLVARNSTKCASVVESLKSDYPQCDTDTVIADMGDLESVAVASKLIRDKYPRLDAIIHNAGALLNQREESNQGLELTIASHVLGPFLMTSLLRDSLRAASGRVVTVSSGGMYAAQLPTIQDNSCLEVSPYNGSRQYALAKRMQVTLNELWAAEEPAVSFYAMHPGWADTPGVQQSIPLFRTVTKPILRTAEQGADTIAWLVVAPHISAPSGTFWCDREMRSIHKTASTRRSDTPTARAAVWTFCNDAVRRYM